MRELSPRVDEPRAARAARAVVEAALDAAGWRWSRRLSRWIDALLVIEETVPGSARRRTA